MTNTKKKFLSSFTTLLVLVLFHAFSIHVNAQPWIQNAKKTGDKNFYEIQKSSQDYWTGKNIKEKGKGWKPFKRWEWFWEQRVYPNGKFPDAMHLYNESQSYVQSHTKQQKGGNQLKINNWTEMGPFQSVGGYAGLGRINCVRVDPNNSNIIWVGSASGGLWKSTNGGTSWSSNTDELPTLGVTDIVIDPSNTNIMYIATGDAHNAATYSVGVLKSIDGGTTWNTTGLSWNTSQGNVISRLLMHPTNSSILLAAGNSGIYKTTNGGTNWTQVRTGSFHDMEFKPGTPGTLYASGNSGEIFRSTNTGDAWTQLTSGLPANGRRVALAVSPANTSYVYSVIVASNSGLLGIYRSTNSGDSWSLRASTPNLLGYAADGSDAGGQGWYDLAIAVSPSNAEEVYVGGINNWKSTNGGANWSLISFWYNNGSNPEVHADQHDLYFVPGTSTLYAGNDGGIYRTTNSGVSWEWLGNGLGITQFYRLGISATSPNLIIGGTQDNGTKTVNSYTWSDVIGGDGMECIIDYSNSSIMYGSLYYGDIQKSTNGGSSFFGIKNNITESGGWVTPYVMHPTIPQILYAGYVNVWKTTDGGASWTKISNFTGSNLNVLTVANSDPNTIYTGTGSTLYKTTNGGTSWTTVTLPTGVAYMTALTTQPTNPQVVWITYSGYSSGTKVYKSTNGGTSWTNISGTLPNVPVNCIVYQNNSSDGLYVGTDIGVYYRDATASDWQDFNSGLPNVVVNELEIQYSTKKLRAATYGRGIWQYDLPIPAVTSIDEKFDLSTSMPIGWAAEPALINGTQTWSLNAGTLNPVSSAPSTPNLVSFNSYTLPSGSTARLITPELNWNSVASAKLAFKFRRDIKYLSNIDQLFIDATTNNGTTWTQIAGHYNRPTDIPNTTYWQDISIDVSSYALRPSVRFAFRAVGAYGNFMHVDNIIIGPPANDLQITSIVYPPTSVLYTGSGYSVRASVKNNGTNISGTAYTVEAWIGLTSGFPGSATYHNYATFIPNIAAGGTANIDIPTTWTPSVPGEYTVRLKVTLAGDEITSNDILDASRTVFNVNYGGGSAANGYYYYANSTAGASGAPSQPGYGWINPVTSGHTEITTWTSGTADDGYKGPLTIGFPFSFFSNSYTNLYVGTNGFVTFSDPSAIPYSTQRARLTIPTSSGLDNFIAGVWTDLSAAYPDAHVYYGGDGSKFVITYIHAHRSGSATDYITFQIILFPNGNIKFQYNDSETTSPIPTTITDDCAVGIENSDGTLGVQYRYGTAGGPIFGSPLAVEFTQDQGSLPVVIVSFTGISNPNGSGVLLEWETISEINNYGFYIERRADNEQNFIEVENSFLPGNGTTLDPHKYSFVDSTISTSGIYHYRLRQQDNDGLIHYSGVVSIDASTLSVDETAPAEFRVYQNYPNPFNPSTQIKFTVEKTDHAVVSVYNVIGQEVAILFKGVVEPGKYYSLKFDGAKFTSGLYFYKVVTNSRFEIKKMLLVK